MHNKIIVEIGVNIGVKYCRNRCKYNYYPVFRLSLLFDFQLLNDFYDTAINKVS